MRHIVTLVLLLLVNSRVFTQTPVNQPPAWAKNVVWYQIFVERFINGDKSNDPSAEDISIPAIGQTPPAGWTTNAKLSFDHLLLHRRYGGDLKGVIDKLDYLKDLGITALFLNPINHAPSLHKYDASSYHHVDANFGPDPKGDRKMMAAENPADPATWKWTAADKLFLKLVQEAHKRGMKVIMDYSWNHTGTRFWAWEDLLKNQKNSKYKDWYEIKSFDTDFPDELFVGVLAVNTSDTPFAIAFEEFSLRADHLIAPAVISRKKVEAK